MRYILTRRPLKTPATNTFTGSTIACNSRREIVRLPKQTSRVRHLIIYTIVSLWKSFSLRRNSRCVPRDWNSRRRKEKWKKNNNNNNNDTRRESVATPQRGPMQSTRRSIANNSQKYIRSCNDAPNSIHATFRRKWLILAIEDATRAKLFRRKGIGLEPPCRWKGATNSRCNAEEIFCNFNDHCVSHVGLANDAGVRPTMKKKEKKKKRITSNRLKITASILVEGRCPRDESRSTN